MALQLGAQSRARPVIVTRKCTGAAYVRQMECLWKACTMITTWVCLLLSFGPLPLVFPAQSIHSAQLTLIATVNSLLWRTHADLSSLSQTLLGNKHPTDLGGVTRRRFVIALCTAYLTLNRHLFHCAHLLHTRKSRDKLRYCLTEHTGD